MATTTFEKKIVLDAKAAKNLANATSFNESFLKETDESSVKNTSELIEWLSRLKK